MNELQRLAFFNAQIVCAQAEIEAMKSANADQLARGFNTVYGEGSFRKVIDTYGLGHNDAITFLRGTNENNNYRSL